MIFSYLILGHLLGDFILQPAKLVEWKMRSKKGIFVHALIHFITNLVIFSPLIYNGYTAMIPISFGVSFIHFWIDSAKISYDLRHDNKVTPFVLDQLLHLVVIIMAYAVSLKYAFQIPNTDFFRFYANFVIINFMSLIIFASMVIEIYKFQKEREKNSNAKIKIHPKDMFIRSMISSFLYVLLMLIYLLFLLSISY